MRRPFSWTRAAVLAFCDAAALSLALSTAYLLWALPMREQSAGLYLDLAPLALLFLVGYAVSGLYPGLGLGPVETLRRLSRVTAFGFLVLASFSFALKLPHRYSRVTFSIALILSLALLPLARALMSYLARNWDWWSEPVVVIGTGPRAARAIAVLRSAQPRDYRPVAILDPAGSATAAAIDDVPVRGGLAEAATIAAEGVRVALIETDRSLNRNLVGQLQRQFRHVVLFRESESLPVEGLQIRHLGNLVGIEYTNNLLLNGNRVAKRALDVIVGGAALVLAAPVIACAAMLVKLADGGPILFMQPRLGLDGRPIAVPKIRTMRRDAEERLKEHLAANPELNDEWHTRYKLKDDPRLVAGVGHFLRRFSIDELPQLWLVLTGDMSLVGPRPFPEYHLETFSREFLELRQRVRPGITGLWQISVRSAGGVDEQETYDSYYIRNWSVWLDIYILSRTLAAVASGRGAY